jgi:hypothetical protein
MAVAILVLCYSRQIEGGGESGGSWMLGVRTLLDYIAENSRRLLALRRRA